MDSTKFINKYPNVSNEEINSLSEFVARECMNSIVEAVEKTGDGENAWQEIAEIFDVVLNEEQTTLPKYRIPSKEIQDAFNKACIDENIEGIKEGLKHFCEIEYDITRETSGFLDEGDSILTDMATIDNINTLKFFIEDDFINRHPIYRNQVNFEANKANIFKIAYEFESTDVLKYLILEHNIEFTPEAKHLLKNGDHKELNKELISLIESKHLKFLLTFDLANNNTSKAKLKI